MASKIDQALIDEILGGDPLLTPAETAAQLGIDEDELYDHATSGRIPSIQPGGPMTQHRYRQSDVTRFTRPAP